ncbi:hypothetical protein [Paenibacillus oryzisoli]|uniref:Uncharacterized protein n=1 Tax=Paenibacillus oryzisoli TaxID=1850517 RepID=A0A198A7V3_9BACL|nr:hypothetical protein [Paenibacillus oryzisoli]OAS17185.1 hypothetical protein A8708_02915 [Paenibacillus oryzisoli]
MTTSWAECSETVLEYPCYGLMNIKQIDGRMLDSKYTPFKVIDMSPSRMGFTSSLSLPTNENVIWCFQFKFHNQEISLCGVLREKSLRENGYVYAVEWLKEETSTGDTVLQTLRFWEYQFKNEFGKAVRGYINAMELANKTTMDVSC